MKNFKLPISLNHSSLLWDDFFNLQVIKPYKHWINLDFANWNITKQVVDIIDQSNDSNFFIKLNNHDNEFVINLNESTTTCLVIHVTRSSNLLVHLARNAALKLILLIDPDKTTNDLSFFLNSSLKNSANLEVYSAALASGNQKITINGSASSCESCSKSNLQFYGAAMDKSSVKIELYNNVVKVASQCVVNQVIKNILLDKKATATGRPVLKIDNNDVIAHHGCALGQIKSEQLFYLMTRGLTLQQALLLLIHSFFNFIINNIKNEEIKNQLLSRINNHINRWKLQHNYND